MRAFGFSTGALALGDFRHALELLQDHETSVIELSALRDQELPGLMAALGQLDLHRYEHVSIHAPSKFVTLSEREVSETLLPVVDRGIKVILHPNAIEDFGCWTALGSHLCIENNDKRKPGRTVEELEPVFERLSEASWCLDIAHARQVDGSLLEMWRMLRAFGGRLAQIHLSELDSECRHRPISLATVRATQKLCDLIPDVPVVIESCVDARHIGSELSMARRCFAEEDSAQSGVRPTARTSEEVRTVVGVNA